MNKVEIKNKPNGFKYSLIEATIHAFLFKVECRGCTYYEVLKNSKDLFKNNAQNTTSNFRQAELTSYSYQKAIKRFKELSKKGEKYE